MSYTRRSQGAALRDLVKARVPTKISVVSDPLLLPRTSYGREFKTEDCFIIGIKSVRNIYYNLISYLLLDVKSLAPIDCTIFVFNKLLFNNCNSNLFDVFNVWRHLKLSDSRFSEKELLECGIWRWIRNWHNSRVQCQNKILKNSFNSLM